MRGSRQAAAVAFVPNSFAKGIPAADGKLKKQTGLGLNLTIKPRRDLSASK
jgi:hypothetical protein